MTTIFQEFSIIDIDDHWWQAIFLHKDKQVLQPI